MFLGELVSACAWEARVSGVLDSSGSRSTGAWGLCITEDLLLAFRKAVGKTREKRRNGLENKKQMKPRMRAKEQTILAEGEFACKHGKAIFNLVYIYIYIYIYINIIYIYIYSKK